MENNIEVLYHSSIRITGEKTIYVDPFKIDKDYNDADYIFCTHTHFDHFSPEDIKKVIKEDTIIIAPQDAKEEALKLVKSEDNFIYVKPDNHYVLENIEFDTTYAYNIDKHFHPKENAWVGYILKINDEKIYIAGDTDNVPEIQAVYCDVALIPIGGTYTMTYEEAANLANTIDAKVVIPTHYGTIVGDKEDGERFKALVGDKEVRITMYT